MIQMSLKAATAAAVGLLSLSAAKADVQFEQRGRVAYLHSQHLQPGDEMEVQAFLDSPRGQGVKIIYMDSRGGNPPAAMAIGQMIRERGIDTGFNPKQGRCASACTTMFLGGRHRYYVGGENIRDAARSHVGLGFHTPPHPSPESEERMNEYYRAMGAPGAARLRYRLTPRESLDQPYEGVGPRQTRPVYFTGSRTAVRAGVATGTRPPADERD